MTMNKLYFITGNDGKFREAQKLIPELLRADIDLPEEQSLDPMLVIEKKVEAAKSKVDGAFLVEDTSLYLDGLNGFPGPLIKWMLQAVGTKGIYSLCNKIQGYGALAKTVVGYYDPAHDEIHFFEGEIDGSIVSPSGNEGFGWDDIFKPNGLDETFAAMGEEFKPEFSMRSQAFEKLKKYLAEN